MQVEQQINRFKDPQISVLHGPQVEQTMHLAQEDMQSQTTDRVTGLLWGKEVLQTTLLNIRQPMLLLGHLPLLHSIHSFALSAGLV